MMHGYDLTNLASSEVVTLGVVHFLWRNTWRHASTCWLRNGDCRQHADDVANRLWTTWSRGSYGRADNLEAECRSTVTASSQAADGQVGSSTIEESEWSNQFISAAGVVPGRVGACFRRSV